MALSQTGHYVLTFKALSKGEFMPNTTVNKSSTSKVSTKTTESKHSLNGTGAHAKTGATIKLYPSPRQLATPTDLKPKEVKAVVEAVNPLIADSFALYVKTKNFHWHLSGSHFRDYHLLFDEQADAIFESIDILAERMRRIGGTTLRSISHISQLQTIEDDNDEFVPPDQMIRRLLDDNRTPHLVSLRNQRRRKE
ncbi:MAG: hypothetical protein NVSMB56_18990 [Pyrinomonadaceae bacterium]